MSNLFHYLGISTLNAYVGTGGAKVSACAGCGPGDGTKAFTSTPKLVSFFFNVTRSHSFGDIRI